MSKKIYEAVENLPEELITPEIAAAAIEEGHIELLDTLPHKYLTGEVIMSIIGNKRNEYSWRGFDLENLPKHLRAKEVCEYAIKKSVENILHTPSEHLSTEMLSTLLDSTERNLKYLHLFPDNIWTVELLTKGATNIYSKTTEQRGPRGGYHGYKTTTDLKPVIIFMSYVPDALKAKAFYLSLFDSKMSADDINELTPSIYKDKEYWLKVAAKDFDVIPERCYDYEIMLIAIESNKLEISPNYRYSYYPKDRDMHLIEVAAFEKLQGKIFKVMDDAMADAVIKVHPEDFKHLPERYRTPERLILAIQSTDRDTIIGVEGNEQLYTEEVCKAYIYRNKDVPKLPITIWTPAFIDCCVTYGTFFQWFDQLPQELQTQEIADKAMNYALSNARHIRPEFISLERAIQLYRDGDDCSWRSNHYQECVPAHYLKDFCNETGLDEKYFGGELSYSQFRERRKSYTYCRIGHSFIAYRDDSDYRTKSYVVTLTRRTPSSFKPVQVFENFVQTFHSTWLEKIIAEYDRTYNKPTIGKALKPYSINPYFSLKKVTTIDGAEVYANNILGGTAYYTAIVGDDRLQTSSLEDMREELTPIEEDVAA